MSRLWEEEVPPVMGNVTAKDLRIKELEKLLEVKDVEIDYLNEIISNFQKANLVAVFNRLTNG